MESSSDQACQRQNHANLTSSLLHLPSSVRKKIYSAAGIVGCGHSAFIDLNQRKRLQARAQNGSLLFTTVLRNSAHCLYTTFSLFLTCKIFYNELVPIVYGNNHFYICYNDFVNLYSLGRLSSLAVRSLTKLTVHLNVVACGLGNVCDGMLHWSYPDGNPEHSGSQTRESLKPDEPNALMALKEWRRVWTEDLEPNLSQPALLELHFICDAADAETALQAIQPLLDAPSGILAGCSIRLSWKANAVIQKLTEATVDHHTTLLSQASQSHFRFLDLPVELQRHILTFTDLIAPLGEVEWSPRMKGMRWRCRLPTSIRNTNPSFIHGSCLQDLPVSEIRDPSYRGCWESSYPSGCYCRCFHSASSNVYPCRCWTPPTALFRVSKAFHKLAIEMFFGSNRFIITPGYGGTWNKHYAQRPQFPRLPAPTYFMRTIPESALPYLRFIELVFPPFGEGGPFDYCPPNTPIWQDWIRTLDYIKDKLILSSLTIRVIFAPWLPQQWNGSYGPPSRAWMSDEHYPEWLRRQKKSYMDVILPMKRLRGLRAFFTHLPCPTPCTQAMYRGQVLRLKDLEEEAERVVMGWEYDAVAAGKETVKDSVWMEMHRLTENG